MTLVVCICCIAIMWYYFTLVDLESQSKGQVSEPVDICLGKVLKKSLIW